MKCLLILLKQNGSTLTIQNGGSVVIKNDFEVKLGGQLIIQ